MGNCYSAAYMNRLEQQRFTTSEVAADWHELMIPWRIMRPSIVRDGELLDPRCSTQTYHRPISALGLHPVAREQSWAVFEILVFEIRI